MKRWMLVVSSAVLLGGCMFGKRGPIEVHVPPKPKAVQPQMVDANGAPIERVAFRAGISSVTVENMARKEGCVGGQGAGLVSETGSVEMYRMICENGKVFQARCELRQCKRM